MNCDRGIWAVIPVKEIALAKTRLGPTLAVALRQELARAMIEDVLEAIAAVDGLAGVAVVTIDPWAAGIAERYGGVVFDEGARDGHTGAVMAAARRLEREGRGGMLTLPGDVPGITPDEIEALLSHHRAAPSFTIVPAHDRRGSNAIVMSPPSAVALAFGNDSFEPHLAAARAVGIEPTIVTGLPGIARDVDGFDDARALLTSGRSRRAREVLLRRASDPAMQVT
ncbi:MAG TPA: 2-phospho-L-lactate guanylyltransferase [Casimicrobiaceae bacterium]|nr:2-phospho-L-lactate guanylyltransferase [Casimicrobiaceae bacterium]